MSSILPPPYLYFYGKILYLPCMIFQISEPCYKEGGGGGSHYEQTNCKDSDSTN